MELKDFITQTLVQIMEGVSSAQETLGPTGQFINPEHLQPGDSQRKGTQFAWDWKPIDSVEFSVAVTATDSAGTGAKIGVTSGIVNASLGGQGEKVTESVNRIKFCVPVCFPRKKAS